MFLFLLPILLLAVCGAVGAAVLSWANEGWVEEGHEWLLASVALGSLLLGWFALLLAELGLFQVGWLAGAAVLLILASWPRRAHWLPTLRWPSLPEASFLVGMVLLTAVLFFRPHRYVSGGADAGVYVNLAATIADTGSITLTDETLTALDPALYPALLRTQPPSTHTNYYWQPALTVDDPATGRITPRFYHLAPVWQAVGYALNGVYGALFLPPLWALLGGWAVYALVRRLWGWPWAAVALLALTSNTMQLWFARYPTTESLTQFLIWVGLWAFVAWGDGREQKAPWAWLAGLAWGATFLARIDTFFMAAIPILLAVAWVGKRPWPRTSRYFFAPLVLLPLHSALHGWFLTRPYFLETFGLVFRYAIRDAHLLGGAAVLGLAILALYARWQTHFVGWVVRYERPLKLVAIAAVLVLAGYNWWVRPFLVAPGGIWNDWYSALPIANYDHENLRRLGWYFTPLGIALAVAGVGVLLWRPSRRTWALLLLGLMFSLLYLTSIRANPIQIYTMRRYVPAVLPFGMVTAVAALYHLWHIQGVWGRWAQGAAVACAIGWISWQAIIALPFTRQVNQVALPEQIAELAAQFPRGSVLIFNNSDPVGQGDFLGTPLAMQHGLHVFVVRDAEALTAEALRETIGRWQADGRAVYWLAVPDGHPWPLEPFVGAPNHTYHIEFDQWEERYDILPYRTHLFTWAGEVYLVGNGR